MNPDYDSGTEPRATSGEPRSNNSFGIVVLVLFVVFLILKLTNTVDWSWWWVTAPIWIPFALAVLVVLLQGEKK